MSAALTKRLMLAVLLAASCSALAESGDVEAGHKKSAPCQVCHGARGISISPQFPNLAGQNADYLVAALKHYRNGRRKNPIMQAQAANLTQRDILDITAYFASLPGLEVKD